LLGLAVAPLGLPTVGERQGVLAGCRLADEIQKYLKCGSVVPLLPANTFIASKATLPTKIGTADASHYYDESMIVTGKVTQVSVRPTITFIDLDGSGRNSLFTAVIFPDNVGKFGDLERFKNQNVEVNGTVTEYRNKPEIILESPDQLKIVDGK